jgi:uncharacterized protein YukE
MTRKALIIYAAIVVTVLFSFTTFAQEQGQEAAAKITEKPITYSDLQTQAKKIEGLKTRHAQVTAEFDGECKGKSQSMEDYQKCSEKRKELMSLYNELKKEVEDYKKNVEQYKAKK